MDLTSSTSIARSAGDSARPGRSTIRDRRPDPAPTVVSSSRGVTGLLMNGDLVSGRLCLLRATFTFMNIEWGSEHENFHLPPD
ncbi:hypothetical protein BREVUG8_110278 [Brevundimonas sp. G8]|nr:hypothetical protein BREVUG8_110278 [Brevundimonas sp. G8]